MKIELDVTMLITNVEIIAEPGDRLMIYNGLVLGVIPKANGTAPPVPNEDWKVPNDEAILAILKNTPSSGITMHTLGDSFNIKSDDAKTRGRLRSKVLALTRNGFLEKNPQDEEIRYPRYRLALHNNAAPHAAS